MVGERTRFFIRFASTFFKLTRGTRWLVIDECHNFAPQGKVYDPDSGKMLHWANRLASEGAGKGITLLSASQRPQKVHKDYVTSHETLIACRVVHKLDRDATKDWIDGCADPQIGKDVLAGLAGLDRSQAYVWSPEIGFGPKLVSFPLFGTYDSFKPQGHGTKALKGWASVNLEEVKTKLATVVEEAKQNDPKALKAEVVRLKQEIAKKPVAVAPSGEELTAAQHSGYVTGYKDGRLGAIGFVLEVLKALSDDIEAAAEGLVEKVQGIRSSLQKSLTVIPPILGKHPQPAPVAQRIERRVPNPKAASSNLAGSATDGDVTLTNPQAHLLKAMAWWSRMNHEAPTREQVAGIAGWKITGGHLKNVIGSLNTRGLVCYPTGGTVSLTETGRAAAPEPDMGLTLIDGIRGILSGPQRQIFDCLLEAGAALSRSEIASRCGWDANGGHLKNVIGSLRTLHVVDYPAGGTVALQDWVQP